MHLHLFQQNIYIQNMKNIFKGLVIILISWCPPIGWCPRALAQSCLWIIRPWCHNKGDYWGPRKKSWCLKSLDSTNPQSDRLCTNGGNSRPLLPSWEVVDQQDHYKAERVIVCKAAKVPRVTSKQLKAFLTLAIVNEPTIRRTLSNHGVHVRVARRKPLFSKKKIAC